MTFSIKDVKISNDLGGDMCSTIENMDGFVDWPEWGNAAKWCIVRLFDDDGNFAGEGFVMVPVK